METTWVLSCPVLFAAHLLRQGPGRLASVGRWGGGSLSVSTHSRTQVERETQRCEKNNFCLISLSCPEEFLPRQGETLDNCLLETRITLFITRMAFLGAYWRAPRPPQETSTANCTAVVQPSRERPASCSPWMVRMVLLNEGKEDLPTRSHPQEPGAGPGREVSLWAGSESPHAQLCTPTQRVRSRL